MGSGFDLLLDLGFGQVFPSGWDMRALFRQPLRCKADEIHGEAVKLLLQVQGWISADLR